jgi:hypothetical protein
MRDIINNETYMKPGVLTTLRYEQLKQWEVGKAVIKEAVNRWTPLGFLDDIEDETKKEVLAIAFDNMAHDLVAEDERVIKIEKRYNFNCAPDDEEYIRGSLYATFDFSVIIFPVLRRIICGVKGTYDNGVGENFSYDKFLDYLEDFSFLAINYDGYDRECDIEAEMAAILSIMIELRFDKDINKN